MKTSSFRNQGKNAICLRMCICISCISTEEAKLPVGQWSPSHLWDNWGTMQAFLMGAADAARPKLS